MTYSSLSFSFGGMGTSINGGGGGNPDRMMSPSTFSFDGFRNTNPIPRFNLWNNDEKHVDLSSLIGNTERPNPTRENTTFFVDLTDKTVESDVLNAGIAARNRDEGVRINFNNFKEYLLNRNNF